jgi:hypothetical protein
VEGFMAFDKSLGGLALATIITAAISSPSCAVPFSSGEFLTYTQGEWGTKNPARTLLVNNYDSVYASTMGLVEIGIPGPAGFSLLFTGSSQVLAYLPNSGAPAALDSDLLNPTTTPSGVFGGDVLGLRFDVDFSDANLLAHLLGVPFGDLKLTGFAGSLGGLNDMSVRNFLSLVNIALGGGSTPYAIPDLDLIGVELTGSFFNGDPQDWAQEHLALPAASSAASIPEPATWPMVLLGFIVVTLMSRKSRSERAA